MASIVSTSAAVDLNFDMVCPHAAYRGTNHYYCNTRHAQIGSCVSAFVATLARNETRGSAELNRGTRAFPFRLGQYTSNPVGRTFSLAADRIDLRLVAYGTYMHRYRLA